MTAMTAIFLESQCNDRRLRDESGDTEIDVESPGIPAKNRLELSRRLRLSVGDPGWAWVECD